MYTPIAPNPPHPPWLHPLPPPRPSPSPLPIMRLRRAPILGSHKIRKRLGLDVIVRAVAVLFAVTVVRVGVVGRPDVLHAVDAAAFGAAFDGAVAGHLLRVREGSASCSCGKVGGREGARWNGGVVRFGLRQEDVGLEVVRTYVEPEYDVTVGWITCAPGQLFVAGRFENDGVVEGACCFIIGALAFMYSMVNSSFIIPFNDTKSQCCASGVASPSSSSLNTPNPSHTLSALFSSLFSKSTLSIPAPSSSPPSPTSRRANTNPRPRRLSKSCDHTRTA